MTFQFLSILTISAVLVAILMSFLIDIFGLETLWHYDEVILVVNQTIWKVSGSHFVYLVIVVSIGKCASSELMPCF